FLSSLPWMSYKVVLFSPVLIGPIAIPATGAAIGTPACIIANVLAQILACEEEPFDSNTSDTRRIVYGKVSSDGTTFSSAFSPSAPWPISLRPGPLIGPVSPTLQFGKL